MSDSAVEPLLRVTRGATVVVAATLAGMGLTLGGRALFARQFSPSGYGLFSLAFTIAAVLAVVATLGLRNGVTRQVAFHGAGGEGPESTSKSEGDLDDLPQETPLYDQGTIIAWGLLSAAVAGAVVGASLYLAADPLARLVFEKPQYAVSLRTAGVALPFLGLIYVFTATFRGLSRTRERVLFQELLMKGSFPLLLLAVVTLGVGFDAALLAYPASLAVTAVVYAGYTGVLNPGAFRTDLLDRLRNVAAGGSLLRFSAPLLFASLLIQVMTWTDVLMLGYFTDARTVGVYDAVRPLVQVVPIIWGSMIFMYTPVVSELHATGSTATIRRSYFVLTKWFASATFPLVLLFVLFPSLALSTVFGPEYTAGATALQVLAVAFLFGNLSGPNGATLTALGRTRVVMYANLVAAAGNVALNLVLVPQYGLLGAAVATAAALIARNTLRAAWLYWAIDAHSFQTPLLVPMALTASAAATLHGTTVVGDWVTTGWHLGVVLAVTVVFYAAVVRLTDNVAVEDRALFRDIRRRLDGE